MRNTYAYATLAAVLLFAGLVVSIVMFSDDGAGRGLANGDAGGQHGAVSGLPGDVIPLPTRGSRGGDRENPGASQGPVERGPDIRSSGGSPELEELLPLPTGAGSIAFIVLDLRDAPIPDVAVRLRSGRAAEDAETGRDGLATFPKIAEGVYSALFDAPGRPLLSLAVPVQLSDGQRKEPISIRLGDFELAIAGRVLGEDGEPVPDITVTALPKIFAGGEEGAIIPARGHDAQSISDESGFYRIENLQEGEYELRTSETVDYPVVKGIVVRAGVDTADIVLKRTRLVRLRGRVTFDGDRPVDEVRVLPVGQSIRSSFSGKDGSYEVSLSVTEDRVVHTVRFLKNGFREERVTIRHEHIRDSDELLRDVELTAIKGLTVVEGTIRDAETGDPVAGETVHLHSQLLKGRHQAISDAEGVFFFDDVESAADYRVWIRPRGDYEDFTRKSFSVSREGASIDIDLVPLAVATLTGQMVDSEGRAVPRFSLWLRSTSAAGKSIQVTGGEQGEFIVDRVPAGKLLFETRSLPRFSITGITAEEGQEKDVSLVIDWGDHELPGVVVDSSGAPIAGAKIFLSWFHRAGAVRSGSSRQTVTDDQGRFLFSQLGPGAHRVNINAEGFNTSMASVDVVRDLESQEFRLELRDEGDSGSGAMIADIGPWLADASFDKGVLLGLIALAMVLYIGQWIATEATSILIVGLLLASGVLSHSEALSGFSHAATVTIGAMFILSAGLLKTGALEFVALKLGEYSRGNSTRLLLLLLLVVPVASAFVNNTPIVVMMVPVVLSLCRRFEIAPSKLLIPLSFFSILGGTCTMLGTSTNIIVADLYDSLVADPEFQPVAGFEGQDGFGLLDFTPLGLVYLAVGGGFLVVFSGRLLPNRASLSAMLHPERKADFVTEVTIPGDSPFLGRKTGDVFRGSKVRLLELLRGEEILLPHQCEDVALEPENSLIVEGTPQEINDFLQVSGADLSSVVEDDARVPMRTFEMMLAEAVILPDSTFEGLSVSELGLNRRFGVKVMAVQRKGRHHRYRIRGMRVHSGDVLLIQADATGLNALRETGGILVVEGVDKTVLRVHKAPVAVGILVSVVAGAIVSPFGLELVELALLGAAAMILTRCVRLDEAFRSLDGAVLLLLAATIPLGLGLVRTGLAEDCVRSIESIAGDVSPVVFLSIFYLTTTLLTAVLPNAVVASLLVPIVFELAHTYSINPEALLMAVCFGASASFLTPIGYQTNAIVMGPGGYTFRDFLRVGLPMTVLMWLTATTLIPVFFPLTPPA